METTKINLNNILKFEQRYRATFINSLGGFKMPVLIGTCDNQCNANLAIFNSLIHIGATPPSVGFIVRPDSVDRHTLQNILETKLFSINHIKEEFYKKAHQTSARYSKEQNEFNEVGLTAEYHDGFIAPFVKESSVKIALEFKQKIHIGINGTILIIGQIKSVMVPTDWINQDGFVDLKKAESIASVGLNAYYNVMPIARLTYAKPNKEIVELKSNLID